MPISEMGLTLEKVFSLGPRLVIKVLNTLEVDKQVDGKDLFRNNAYMRNIGEVIRTVGRW
jgi:hypothetical protein